MSTHSIDKTYSPQSIEQKWYQEWEEKGYFKPSGEGDAFSIMIPPPNVTGSLHMGHAFQDSIMDLLTRYQRMQGKNTLWQVGTDHAGIATQMVVERQLAAQDIKRHDLGRDAFIDKVWVWKAESGGTITRQLRRLGASVDWSRERFTMDEGLSDAVAEVFIRLYRDDLIYRGKRLVNWDPKLCTAISDLEVENHDKQGQLWYFRFPLADGATTSDGKNYLVVATTRPETILGDSGVGVNPNDERYQELIGKHVQLPLVDRKIPIIADRYVDPEFGTGCVKLTPAHDFNDYEVGKNHKLPLINIFDEHANVLETPQAYDWQGNSIPELEQPLPESLQGLERFAARKAVIAAFEEQGLLEKIEPHALKVPMGDRSGVVIEPLLTDQWYVRIEPLAKPAIEAVENGDIEFVPKQYENMYFSWMRDIQDWCISRQLWWGHRIPAWYDEQGNIYVGRTEADVREHYQLADDLKLKQDDDVLDTWFSSALWTFSTLGWPNSLEDLKTFHPSSVLVTGFDIIFFWVARMIMMTLYFIKDENGKSQVPFKTVYVTGLIRDENGQKMSKSKGNVLDPLDMIDGISGDDLLEKRTSHLMQPKLAAKIAKQTTKQFPDGIEAHGTDALRFTLTSLASTGRDINWDMKRLEGYRNFCNKLWNASRYVFGYAEQYQSDAEKTFSLADQWITSQLQSCIANVCEAVDNYRFDLASQYLYEFIWNQFCDWYLELSKPVLNSDDNPAQRNGTLHTLLNTLETTLRLAHPFMPFITEEIWQMLKAYLPNLETESSIMLAAYPQADASKINAQANDDIEWIKQIITATRNIRGELSISPAKELNVLLAHANPDDVRRLNDNQTFIKSLAKLTDIRLLADGEKAPLSSTQVVGILEILVPMKGLIDVDAECQRLDSEIDKMKKECQRFENKLSNENFVARAPADVVEKEKEKLAKAQQTLSVLVSKRNELENM